LSSDFNFADMKAGLLQELCVGLQVKAVSALYQHRKALEKMRYRVDLQIRHSSDDRPGSVEGSLHAENLLDPCRRFERTDRKDSAIASNALAWRG